MSKSKHIQEPTIEEWRRLYDAAVRFRQHECWNYLRENDVFGVRNPETGKIGYCCVMGIEGVHLALAVYRGTEGLEGLARIFSGMVDPTSADALHVQNCIMASFEDRRYLNKEDMEIIKALNLEFRGPKAWPQFRDYTPGFVPWHLNGKDARFLTIALDQTIEMSERIREDPEILGPEDEEKMLVRVLCEEDDDAKWTDKWLVPDHDRPVLDPLAIPETRERLGAIKKADKSRSGTWEVGTYYLSEPVKEGQRRPYFPRIILYVDHDSHLILSFLISEPVGYQEDLVAHFISLLEGSGNLPENIVASDYEILKLLSPISEELGVELFVSEFLDAVEEVRRWFDTFSIDGAVDRPPARNTRKKRKRRRR